MIASFIVKEHVLMALLAEREQRDQRIAALDTLVRGESEH